MKPSSLKIDVKRGRIVQCSLNSEKDLADLSDSVSHSLNSDPDLPLAIPYKEGEIHYEYALGAREFSGRLNYNDLRSRISDHIKRRAILNTFEEGLARKLLTPDFPRDGFSEEERQVLKSTLIR